MRKLDILAFNALDAEKNLFRVTNGMLWDLVRNRSQGKIDQRCQELYEKLLRSDRSRYVAMSSIDDNLDDDYFTRYEKFRHRSALLATRCIDELMAKYPFSGSAVRAIVTNTTVGGTVPNLSSVVSNHLGLGHQTRVIDLGYMGCATALLALEVIEQQLRPGELGLVLSSELTSVMANIDARTDASLVANTVFGDGVGAFLVARRPHREKALLRIVDHEGSVQTSDEALSAITYEPNHVYHEIRIHETIPAVAATGVRQVMKPLVRRNLCSWPEKVRFMLRGTAPAWQRHVSRVLLHTAGSKVLEGLTSALGLSWEQVQHNFLAFNKYGNTSSASLYYALNELVRVREIRRGEVLLFLGYGSGFMVRGTLMEGA